MNTVDSRDLGRACEPHCIHQCRIECVQDGSRTGRQCDDKCESDCKTYCAPMMEGETDGDKLLGRLEQRSVKMIHSSSAESFWFTYALVLLVSSAVGFLAFKKYFPDGFASIKRFRHGGYFQVPSMV